MFNYAFTLLDVLLYSYCAPFIILNRSWSLPALLVKIALWFGKPNITVLNYEIVLLSGTRYLIN